MYVMWPPAIRQEIIPASDMFCRNGQMRDGIKHYLTSE